MTGRMKRGRGTLSPAERTRKLAELLGREFSVHHADEKGWTDLHHAVVLGDLALARHLLDHGAAVNSRLRRDGERWSYRLTRMLRECGYIGRSHQRYRDGGMPLRLAARSDDCEMAELLIAYEAELNAKSATGATPLHEAALRNAHAVAEVLIVHGARTDTEDNQGATPLHEAALSNACGTAKVLIAGGAPVDAVDKYGSTPLGETTLHDAHETARLLIASGAEVDRQDKGDFTPLDAALDDGARETAILLIENGARPHIPALHLTAWLDAPEAVDGLIEKGARLDEADQFGLTPLHWAVRSGVCEKVKEIISNSAHEVGTMIGWTSSVWKTCRSSSILSAWPKPYGQSAVR